MDCRSSGAPWRACIGNTREEAIARVKALSLRVLADRVENGEAVPEMEDVFSVILQNLTPPMCPKRPKRHSLVI